VITPIATDADGLLGAANMANGAVDLLGTGQTSSIGPAVLKIRIT